MFATANFEVKISRSKGPPPQSMWATHNGWVFVKYLMNYGAGFPKKVRFSKEQSIAGKTEGPPRIPRLSNVRRGQGLCYRVSNQFPLLQGFEWVRGVMMMFLGQLPQPSADQSTPPTHMPPPFPEIYSASGSREVLAACPHIPSSDPLVLNPKEEHSMIINYNRTVSLHRELW